MPSWNPFDWVDNGLDAAGETWDAVKDTFKNLVVSGGRTIFPQNEATAIIKPTVEATAGATYGAAKLATRATTTAFDFPLQVLNNTMAFGYNNPYIVNTVLPGASTVLKGKGFKKAKASTLEQAVGIIRNTTLSNALADALPGGQKFDLGSGFFPGGQTVQDVNAEKRNLYPTIYGSTFTVGRAFAAPLADNGVIEPGSTAYNAISGGIDAAWTVGADPTNWVPAGAVADVLGTAIPLTAAARAGKRATVTTTLTRNAKKVIKRAAEDGRLIMNNAGLIENGRRTVNPNNWEAFKVTKKGQSWLDGFVGDKSGSAAEIWRKSGGQIPPGTATKLEKAQTLDEVKIAFDDAVYGPDPLTHIRIMPGIDPRPIVTRVGATIKGNASRYRAFGDTLPEATDFPLNNPVKAIYNADAVMGVLKVDLPVRNKLLNDLFHVMDGTDNKAVFDWLGEFEKTVVASQLKKWNYTDDEIKRIAGWRKRYQETISGYVTDSAGSSVPLEWLVGGPQGGYGPLLLSQMLKVNPVLIDPEDLRNIADRLGPVRSRLEKARRVVVEQSVDPVTGEKIVDVTKANTLVNTPVAMSEALGDLGDYLQARAWKPNILLRPRYLLRTLPEEMLRVSASGVYDHGFQYIAHLFTNKNAMDVYGNMIITSRRAAKLEAQASELGRVLSKYDSLTKAGITSYKGRKIADLVAETNKELTTIQDSLKVFDERMAKMLPGMDEALLRGMPKKTGDLMLHPAAISGMIKRGNLISVERATSPDLWSKAMAQRLAERASNDYYRKIAEMMLTRKSVDDITARFFSGDLKNVLEKYKAGVGNLDPNYVWDYNGVRNFVQKNIDDLNLYTFKGDDSLLRAIADNAFQGEKLSSAKGFQSLADRGGQVAKYEPNKILKKYIKDTYSADPNAPTRVNYFPSIYDTDKTAMRAGKLISQRYDALMNLFWDGLYGASSDKLGRNPLWNQAKWQRIIELVPVMSPGEAAKLAKNVEGTRLAKTLKDDIIDLAGTAKGEMTVDDVEMLAELFATRFTKDNFFDASRKTAFGAAHRKLFPFFDAFVELTGSALKLATNPKVLHRADKVIGELRSNTFMGSDLNGDGKKESFLYRDPVSGQEMYAFAAPGGFLQAQKKMGLDFKFGNTLDSLSMITTPYPGLSPFVALPVTKMLPDQPEFEKLRSLIAPYGVPDISDPSILQYLVPGASEQVQRILGSNGVELFSRVENREKLMQATIRAMQAIMVAKDYDPATPGVQGPTGYDSLQQWQADGKELGLKIFGLTGWAGLFLPGAPIAQWSAKTKQGNVLLSVLSQRWNQIDQNGDKVGLKYQDKLEQFVEEFGSENLVAFLQPITERSITGSNSSREYYDWYRQNKGTVDKYPDVGGYFSPKSGELDPDVWNIQKIAGEVGYKKPEEFAKRVESAVANFLFNRNMRQFEEQIPAQNRTSKEAQAQIKAYKSQLSKGIQDAYPAWDRATAATESKNQRKIQFLQIERFVNEPSQQTNPVVIAAKEYLDIRKANIDYVTANAPSVNADNWKTMTKNPAAIALRSALWDEGEKLAEQYPAFVNLWQNVLSREFISVDTGD